MSSARVSEEKPPTSSHGAPLPQGCGPGHGGDGAQAVQASPIHVEAGHVLEALGTGEGAPAVAHADLGCDRIGAGVTLGGHEPAQAAGGHHRVRIDGGDEPGRSQSQAHVERGRFAPVLGELNQLHAWIGYGLHGSGGVVGGAVVHYDHPERGEVATEQALHGAGDDCGLVPGGDDYRERLHRGRIGGMPALVHPIQQRESKQGGPSEHGCTGRGHDEAVHEGGVPALGLRVRHTLVTRWTGVLQCVGERFRGRLLREREGTVGKHVAHLLLDVLKDIEMEASGHGPVVSACGGDDEGGKAQRPPHCDITELVLGNVPSTKAHALGLHHDVDGAGCPPREPGPHDEERRHRPGMRGQEDPALGGHSLDDELLEVAGIQRPDVGMSGRGRHEAFNVAPTLGARRDQLAASRVAPLADKRRTAPVDKRRRWFVGGGAVDDGVPVEWPGDADQRRGAGAHGEDCGDPPPCP